MGKLFLLDSNIFDKIAEDPSMFELVLALAHKDVIELLVTHSQNDELVRIPDTDRSAKIDQIPRQVVPRTSAILGEMTLGSARLGTTGRIDDAIGEADRILGGEAKAQGLLLVSEDRRLRNGARREGLTAWDWSAFAEHLHSLKKEEPESGPPPTPQ
jgi:hypothetical protein